ncbi:MAG: hypothetical protein BWY83_02831 [bacterium ADurb.Bin478]|nr:MAG: hypothetical protein BWY83_02831 [bacterium ADurb.Bin478]
MHRPLDPCLRIGHITHRFLRRNPWAAGLAPSRTVEQADVYAQAAALAHRMLDHFPPFRGERFDRALDCVFQMNVADKRFADADGRHGLQIPSDALTGNVVGDPIPIDPGFCRLGRMMKSLDQRGLPAAGKQSEDHQAGGGESDLVHLVISCLCRLLHPGCDRSVVLRGKMIDRSEPVRKESAVAATASQRSSGRWNTSRMACRYRVPFFRSGSR